MHNRVTPVLVTNSEAANTGTSIATAVNGDILILNKAGAVLTGTPTASSAEGNDTIQIALGIGNGRVKLSDPIPLKSIQSIKRAPYAAPVEQITHIGFNGTTGTIAVANNTEYILNIVLKDELRLHGERQGRRSYNFPTDATATAAELVFGLVSQMNNDNTFINSQVGATILSDGTFAADANGATVTNGSRTIAQTAHAHVVGDLVRIGGTGASSPVYQVASVIDANTFTISTPYQGASAAIAAANIGEITGATNFGIQLTGKSQTVNPLDEYISSRVSFEASMYAVDGASQTVTYTTKMTHGSGTFSAVKDMEELAQAFDGIYNRTMFPVTNPPVRAAAGTLYNILNIEFAPVIVGGDPYTPTPKGVTICFASASAPTKSTKETAVIDILESLTEGAHSLFVE